MVDPLERVRRLIGRSIPYEQELVETGTERVRYSALGLLSFLYRMPVFPCAVGFVCPLTLVSDIVRGMIYAHDAYAHRVVGLGLDLLHLVAQVVLYPVQLLDHGLGQNLNFDSDLNVRDLAVGHCKSGHDYGRHTGNTLTECPVTAAGPYAAPPILYVDN